MNKFNDGGPAFPRPLVQPLNPMDFAEHELRAQNGMTLRDYFAAKAMASLLAMEANPRVCPDVEPYDARFNYGQAVIAVQAYELADAMLAARKGGA